MDNHNERVERERVAELLDEVQAALRRLGDSVNAKLCKQISTRVESGDAHIIDLNCANICQLHSGVFAAVVDRSIENVLKDIVDRPVDGAGKHHVRKIIIQLDFTPETELENGVHTLSAIGVEASCKGQIPVHRTMRTDVRIKNGRAKFNVAVPGRFEQRPLDFNYGEVKDVE